MTENMNAICLNKIAQHPDSEMQLEMRFMPLPENTNANGTIFGGYIVSQIDLAGAAMVERLSGGPAVTVKIESLLFKKPVYVGDLVSIWGKIVHVGNTSVQVKIDVRVNRRFSNEVVDVTEAMLTYVAVDKNGEKRIIQPVT